MRTASARRRCWPACMARWGMRLRGPPATTPSSASCSASSRCTAAAGAAARSKRRSARAGTPRCRMRCRRATAGAGRRWAGWTPGWRATPRRTALALSGTSAGSTLRWRPGQRRCATTGPSSCIRQGEGVMVVMEVVGVVECGVCGMGRWRVWHACCCCHAGAPAAAACLARDCLHRWPTPLGVLPFTYHAGARGRHH